MTYIALCVLVLNLVSSGNATHFLGGTITWHPRNKSATGTPIAVVITQTYLWLYSRITCTNAMIATNQLIPLGTYTNLNTTKLECIANCGNSSLGYVAPTVVPYCTGISPVLGVTYSQRSDTVYLEVGDDFSAAFQSFGWRSLTYALGSAPWSISTHIIVKARSDNGLYNTAPVATIASPINIPANVTTVIHVPVADADGDLIRCRWSVNGTAGADECGGVCPPCSLPPNTIIYPNCTIVITGQNISDWYAVALMVEDFINISSADPLSSIPVQFLVSVVSPPNCTTPPAIVGKPAITFNWSFIGTAIVLTLLGAITLSCCWYCCYFQFVGRRPAHKHHGPPELYHIEQCLDPDCPWQTMSSSLTSKDSSVCFTTSSRSLLSTTNGDNSLIMGNSRDRNQLLAIDKHVQTKSATNILITNVKRDNAIERVIKSDVGDNRKVSQMKSIVEEINHDFDDELPEQKVEEKRRDNEIKPDQIIHLHCKPPPIVTHQSSMKNEHPIHLENAVYSHRSDTTNQSRSFAKHLYHTPPGENESTQIETIELSSLDSTSKRLNTVTYANDVSPSNMHMEFRVSQKKEAASKETVHPVESGIEKRKRSKPRKVPVQIRVVVKPVRQENIEKQYLK